MIVITYFLLLICLLSPLKGSYYLIVEYGEVFQIQKQTNLFEYRNQLFKTKKNMITKIKRNFFFFPKYYLLLKLAYMRNNVQISNYKSDGNYYKCDGSLYKPDYSNPSDKFPIIAKYKNCKMLYFCGGTAFINLKLAKECSADLQKYYNDKSQYSKIQYSKSSDIWKKVWDICYYECFTKENYKNLKKGLLEELNLLRERWSVAPVKCSETLNRYADRRNDEKNGVVKKISGKLAKNSYKEITASIYPAYASTQMNVWYNQFLKRNPSQEKNKKIKNYNALLKLLFSDEIKETCCGAVKVKEKLMITCLIK